MLPFDRAQTKRPCCQMAASTAPPCATDRFHCSHRGKWRKTDPLPSRWGLKMGQSLAHWLIVAQRWTQWKGLHAAVIFLPLPSKQGPMPAAFGRKIAPVYRADHTTEAYRREDRTSLCAPAG